MQKNIKAFREYNTKVFVLSTDSHKQSENVIKQLNLSFKLLCDDERSVVDLFKLRNPFEHDGTAYPATFIIDPEGKIRYRSIDGTAKRVDLRDELSFLEQLHGNSGHTMHAGPKKSWVIPSLKDNWRMSMNMMTKGSFADWKNFLLLPVNYLKILVNKIKTMRFLCRPVDLDFLHSAPVRFVNEVTINAVPHRVFEALEDPESWPKWFKEIVKVEWTSPKPFGVGATRTVTLKAMTAFEKFNVWETGKRFTFYFTKTSLPFANAFCEDYRLEDSGSGTTRFIYTVALEPRFLIRVAGPVGRFILGRMFQNGARSLAIYMER